MALIESTLATQIQGALDALTVAPAPDAVTKQAEAFGEYFKGAVGGGIPVVASAVDTIAVPAMIAGMSFPLGTPSEGAANFQAGHSAFWTSVVGAPAVFFPGVLAVIPPTLASLASAIESQFASNNAQGITSQQAADNLASAIHPNAGLGGQVTIGVSNFPIV